MKSIESILQIGLKENELSAAEYQKVHDELGTYPNAEKWNQFLFYFCLIAGFGFFLSGVIFFSAYNWAHTTKFQKLCMVTLIWLVSVGSFLYSNSQTLTSHLLALGSSILTGVMFAVFGQIYQTGADSYQFFMAWGFCILIWTVISQSVWQWALFFMTVNLSVYFYRSQVHGISFNGTDSAFIYLSSLNLGFLLLVEILLKRRFGRTTRHLTIGLFAVSITAALLGALTENPIFTAFYLVYAGGMLLVFYRKIRDLVLIAVCYFGLIWFFITKFQDTFTKSSWNFVLMGGFLLGLGTVVMKHLQFLSKKWGLQK